MTVARPSRMAGIGPMLMVALNARGFDAGSARHGMDRDLLRQVLCACEAMEGPEADALMALLRRMDAEAAREALAGRRDVAERAMFGGRPEGRTGFAIDPDRTILIDERREPFPPSIQFVVAHDNHLQ